MSVTQAAILAAGAGSKCWPYTETRPKALLPVATEPLVDRLIGQLQRLGIERVVVAVGPDEHGTALSRHLAGQADVAAVETDRGGTAAALTACFPELVADDPALVMYGDVVTAPENLDAVATAFAESGSDVAACTLVDPVPGEDPRGWIVPRYRDDRADGAESRHVDRFVGGARSGEQRMSGIFALGPSTSEYIRGTPGPMREVPVGGMPPQEATLAGALNAAIDDGHRVDAVPAPRFHVDVDKPWHVLAANRRVVTAEVGALETGEIHPSATVSEGATLDGNVHLGEGCELGADVIVDGNVWLQAGARVTRGARIDGPAVVGSEAELSDHCHLRGGSVVGPRCRIGHTAEFGGVMFEGAYMVHYGQLGGVIGRRTDIGAGTVSGGLRFDDSRTVHETDGFREQPPVGANAIYLGDHSRTGVNVTLLPGVKVGAYSCLGPGAIIEEDVDSRTLLRPQQEHAEHPWGPERYGW